MLSVEGWEGRIEKERVREWGLWDVDGGLLRSECCVLGNEGCVLRNDDLVKKVEE